MNVVSPSTSTVASTDGVTQSLWAATAPPPKYGPLLASTSADVCIVGAGIAGLSVAYLLASENKSVIVLDDSPIGDGQTGRTSAHLASAIDDRFFELRRLFGDGGAKLAYLSHAAAIERIESICTTEKIDCDFKRIDGYLFLAPGQDPELLERELAAAQIAGVEGVERLDRADVQGFDTGPCLRFPRQARFHPMKYLAGLARAIEARGGRICCGNRVEDVQPGKATTARGYEITADSIVVATNTPAPINNWMGIYTKQAAYRTYVVALRIPKGSVSDALYWDAGDPYHYVRIDPGESNEFDLLIVGGEDHKTGQFPKPDAAPFLSLMRWARERFKYVGEEAFNWSGQVQEPIDGVAFIGKCPTLDRVYVATGDSGQGLTHGTIAGILISDLIMGRGNPWTVLYDPARKTTAALGDFAHENLNAAEQYAKYVTPGEVARVDEIPLGSGAIMRDGLKKVAVYRDGSGAVRTCSAVCTHLGCIVSWNDVEKTWDCPCHGARYDPAGHVILGPAIGDLKPLDPE